VDRHQLATYHESSGDSRKSDHFLLHRADWADLAERSTHKRIGILPTDTLLIRTPYALMITGHMAHTGGRLGEATVVPGDHRSLAMPYSRVARVMRDLGVTLTWSVPTECLIRVAAVPAVGLNPRTAFPALRGLFVGGEPLGDARRRRINRLWRVPVINDYGSTETGALPESAWPGECTCGPTAWCSRHTTHKRAGSPRTDAVN